MFRTVEQSIPAELISGAPHPVPVTVRVVYSADDPLAVRMVFPAAVSLSGGDVTWIFARSLLDRGLRAPSGLGDVHIRPGDRAGTTVELRAAQGVALLRFATGRLRHFLLHSYATVPAGLEARALDIDGGLAALLRGAREGQD
ncbi:SsgA family sporulation/cell division regulator [Streptomyces katsurahamanus]|uniref:SsgA family sporulation/cell division regulator n=1 Tax=Streptomyces katsurahamanus TaxID=2577098 RepID=A0ABW9NNM1_9ACTN|nr:SsgA family sporulation/cell division regulator [Streptomyces katsurahamanus]MQS34509.1 SsgA family sporulation/cell division regulator [Streptomyces katsurahamanus]